MSLPGKHVSTMGILLCITTAWATLNPVPALAQDATQPTGEPAAEPAEPPDPYRVPDGTPQELAEFIQRILSQPPPNAQARQKAIAAMQEAAEKILTGKPDDASAEVAVRVKAMFTKSPQELEALAKRLTDVGQPKLARRLRGTSLVNQLQSALGGPDSEKKIEQLIGKVKGHLAEGPLEQNDVQLAMTAGRTVERSGNDELAAETYTSFAKLFAASKDEAVAGLAKMLEGVARRLTLVGNKMKVEGTLLDGEKLDWAAFSEGKVVLVDFWASWCGPCVREVPNMKETYGQYRDRGFEILGISLDRGREPLEAFIEKQEIPWTIVYDETQRNPTADYYGVTGIPTMVLVGQDGNVVSTSARGPKLREELAKLLGPADQPGDGEDHPEDSPESPQEETSEKADPSQDPVVIKIGPKGVLSVGGEPLDGRSLYVVLNAEVPEGKRRDTPILIQATADVEHKNIVRGINVLKKMGFRRVKFEKD